MTKNNFLVFFCILPAFFGCGNGSRTEINTRYQVKSFVKEAGDCGASTDYCVSIKVNYPYFTSAESPAVKDSLNNQVSRMILQPVFEWKIKSLEKLADSLTADYNKLKKEFPDSPVRYELERNVTVGLNRKEVVSLEFNEYSYLGGAHPNSLRVFRNINSNTGQKISLDQLFIRGFEEELTLIGERKFREARELKPEDDLEKSGFWFNENKFSLTGNFLITEKGLRFFFNDYEVAPHSVGPTEIFIPFGEIEKIIDKGGILSSFLQ